MKPLCKSALWKSLFSFLVASLIPGILIGLSWRIPGFGLVGVFGLAVFFYVQASLNKFSTVFLSAMGTGTAAYLIACSWFGYTIGYLIHIDRFWADILTFPVSMLQGGHYALFAVIWLFARRISKFGFWLAPFLWIIVQGNWPGLFPCRNGCLLLDVPNFCQIAEIGGVDLVSLFAASLSLGLTVLIFVIRSHKPEMTSADEAMTNRMFRSQGVFYLISLSFVAATVFLWGQHRVAELSRQMRVIKGKPLRLLMVQANTEYKESNARMIEVSRQFKGQVDLIVWPESSLGSYNRELKDFADAETVVKNSVGKDMQFQPFPDPAAPLLAGASTWQPNANGQAPKSHFVSALLFDQNEQLVGRRDKVELMPYGESIPGESLLPFLRTWMGSKERVLQGEGTSPIGDVGDMKIGVALCCEDMSPKLVRQLVSQGADLIMTLGNGIAFDSEVALNQHFRIAQLRAIEHRKYFVRCTSHGVSGLVDPTGKLIIELPMMIDGAAMIDVPRVRLPSAAYSSNGSSVEAALICFPVFMLIGPGALRLRKRFSGREASGIQTELSTAQA